MPDKSALQLDFVTPVEEHDGLLVKRDDIYRPFGVDDVNGGKLRQCAVLVSNELDRRPIKTIWSGCSMVSPQAAIVAAIGEHFGIPVHIVYGGTNEASLRTKEMPMLARKHGAIIIPIKIGYSSVVEHHIKENATDEDFIVKYGINLEHDFDALVMSVAMQCCNLPDRMNRLIITCGSGITSLGIFAGLRLFGKQANEIILCGVGPDRRAEMRDRCWKFADEVPGLEQIKYTYHQMDEDKGYSYHNTQQAYIGQVKLHPIYEAKTMNYLRRHNYRPESGDLFWIVGAKPNYFIKKVK